ncbi:MAG: glucoamylase family protein [Actinomycetota bacterium]|nr:glucoamylase family protein [Actinomycetota bacterium]
MTNPEIGYRDEQPLRAELLTVERLKERARELASAQHARPEGPRGGTPLIELVERAAVELAEHSNTLSSAVRAQQAISPASEWLLDNYYLIEEQVRLVREDLPAHYGKELPSLAEGDYLDYPRVYEAIATLVSHTDSRIDEDYVLRFIGGYQDSSPLTIGEVWAIPIMLRVALVENLRRLSRQVVRVHQDTWLADTWADRLLITAQDDPSQLRTLIDELDVSQTAASATFYIRLSQRLQGQDVGGDALNAWLERRLTAAGISLEDASHTHQQEQAADQVSIANSITSVRFLDAYDWNAFFETVSFVEAVLRQDPAGIYERMDFKSRDRYRHALEAMSKRCAHTEIEVAEAAVSWALDALTHNPSDPVIGHIGHYFISGGRYALENSIDYRPHGRERLYRGPLRHHGPPYWGLLALNTTLLAAALGAYSLSSGAAIWRIAVLMLISVIPLSDLAINLTNHASAWVFPPRVLPKLDVMEPLSQAHRTLVIVPALMSSVGAVRSVLDNLEITYLANRDDNIAFGLLGDLKGSSSQRAKEDGAIIEAAIDGTEVLNDRYEREHGRRPFFVFIRGRRLNEAEETWMGWERKRGALMELNRLLKGSSDVSFTHQEGDEPFLRDVTFVLTLDADTLLPRDGARKLVCTIAHPLNRSRVNPGDPRVARGYGLVQPRVGMSLPASSKSFFAWLYSGTTGIDPYAGAVSDTYQDVFGEGSFTGKGIFEVGVFNAILEDRLPENTLLSHDLLEGCYLRTALASDIEVLDDHPSNYLSHVSRLHRWVRGDWQTLPWLFPRVPISSGQTERNPLSPLHRWKIIDNLRRSLVPPTLLLLIAVGWVLLPGPAWTWPLVMMLVLLFPVYFALVDAMLFRPRSISFSAAAGLIWSDFTRDSVRALLALVLLPHQAWLMTDAIVRALWRMGVSRRLLLEWETAADADRRAGSTLPAFIRKLGPSSAFAIALVLPGTALDPVRLILAIPLAATWALAPYVAWRVSRTKEHVPEVLTERDVTTLRRTARRTWRFFETFTTAETHWLAPDNFQEVPGQRIAYRTSPTNIGLQLMSYLTAYDLGYITLDRLTAWSSDTLHAMAGLERFRGHFYNWYDILTLQPLPPNYVSTVDSGNLAGHLLVLRIGLLEASEAPLVDGQVLAGLVDTASMAVEDLFEERDDIGPSDMLADVREQLEQLARDAGLAETPENLGAWRALLQRLSTLSGSAVRIAADLAAADPSANAGVRDSSHPATPLTRAHNAVACVHDSAEEALTLVERLAPWAELVEHVPQSVLADPRCEELAPLLEYVPSLVGLAEGLIETVEALDSLAKNAPGATETERDMAAAWAHKTLDRIMSPRSLAAEMLGRLRLDADIAREMWEHTDFQMLFDKNRLLFAIGYNTAEGRPDRSFYDMLASECRLASFLAIAKGDVPQEHWFRLGRAITATGGGRALLSWSASMFEYLMPLLVMRSWPRTLLDETYTSVVRRQIQYGNERSVPWGVSESAFNSKDAELTYQYQAFGVPGLGLKRGLSDDVVVAPYAAILALPIAPRAVLRNLDVLTEQGARGRYGYYESIDYTPGRVPAGRRRAVVRSYFAHHQGMSLVALGNQLTGNRMTERFHADPMVVSAELLLQERVPRGIELAHPHVEEVQYVRSVRELPPLVTRAYPLYDTPVPATHFLSNGSYSVMVTNAGGGYSRWRGLAVSRYREDVTRDCWGQFFYLRDTGDGMLWSATGNPCPSRPDDYHATFSADKAEFRRRDGDIETHTEVSVSPEDDVEIRRITVTNRGRKTREIEVTSYFEVALTFQDSDQAHRSFSNLFVETEAIEEHHALLFSRRPRSADEHRYWGFHVMGCDASAPCDWSFETDRVRFLGRLRQADEPVAVGADRPLSGTTGAVLDPACAIRRGAQIGPGESARFVYVTGVADSREAALRLTDKYHDIRSAQRSIDLAWTASQIELRDLGLTAQEAVTLQRLASRLLLTDPTSPLKVKPAVENGLRMSGLWSLGISGDLPILLVRIEDLEHAPLVRQALLAHQYWRHKGLVSDLVILNTRPSAYSEELDERLKLLVRTGHALQVVDKPGGVFLRRADQMHPDVLNLLLTVARATLEGDAGSIEIQLNRRGEHPVDPAQLLPVAEPVPVPSAPFERPGLLYDNGYGGFDGSTGEYVIVLGEGEVTPAPWVNVMATPEFGCMVSEAGIGCTWAHNSHENRITTWNNDPVSDGSGEATYLRDEETGEFWSPTPLPSRDSEPYVIRHGKGHSRFEHTSHGIEQQLDWFASTTDPVRIVRLKLRNLTDRPRHISATHFVEWVLGSSRSKAQQLVVTWYDAEIEMLTAHNHYNPDFPGRAAFLASDRPLASYTGSRTEFVGRNRRPSDPVAMHRSHLDARTGAFHDNCGALMIALLLDPGAEEEVSFFLGQTDSLDEARAVVARYREDGSVDRSLAEVGAYWSEILGTVQVSSPDPALDLLVNGQLLYQALACRLWGRTATYQSSGAFGFRDQLQDVLAMLYARPDLVRAQIVEASRHQFEQGDVLHWWQPTSGRGVRTRITDDRHWLPFVTSEYLAATGDASVLDEVVAFIEGGEVESGREDNYMQPAVSERAATVYEHCVAALESGRGTGPHGLPLIGGGDWNDGMNHVGIEGQGESVWLAWFLNVVLTRFAPVCEMRGDHERASDYREWAQELVDAVERDAWDGSWYRRAYFDDGTPLGTRLAEECRIDAIAQAWATISGAGDPQRAIDALDAVEEKLVRREDRLIALLAPPFNRMKHDPGYIKGYVPGVRENGGQYTHAAIWVVLAYLLQGDGDEAHGMLDLINPINHARSLEDANRYKVEPYVVAADVYAAPPHIGRGGWTWYTGSASWFYRVAVQNLFGLTLCAEDGMRYLAVEPCIPRSWERYEMSYRYGTSTYRISVHNPRGVNRGVERIALDGEVVEGLRVLLADDGETHDVEVALLGG